MAGIVEILWPLGARADRLGAMPLFAGLRWSELQALAPLFEEFELARGTRLTVQGRRDRHLWLIASGEALVSADARPLRVIRPGDAAGVPGMLYSIASPETTIALTSMRGLAAGPDRFEEVVADDRIRRRLTALAGDQMRFRRPAKPR